jgi:outer membrane protein, heavy metal efflux system
MNRTVFAAFGCVLALVLWTAPTIAAPSAMEAFVAEVLRNNPSLSARTLARAAVDREASAAGFWPDPAVAVMLDNVPEREGGEMPMVRYQLSQMFPWPGKLDLMRAAVARRGDRAQADTDTRRLELVFDARRAYLMLALNAQRREINRGSKSLLDIVQRAALARYGAGVGDHHDVSRSQVERNALDLAAIDLDGERSAVLAMMNALRNKRSDAAIADPILAKDDEPALPRARKLEALALARRPELKRMRAMQREEGAMAALARRERYPDIMTSVWYNQMLGAPDSGGVMVGAALPVFGARKQNRLAGAADLRSQSVDRDAQAMRAMIRFEVADAARKVRTAAKTLAFLRDVAQKRAQDSFQSGIAGYGAGTLDIVGVLDAWRALQAVELARAEANVMHSMAWAELERAVGSRVGKGVR